MPTSSAVQMMTHEKLDAKRQSVADKINSMRLAWAPAHGTVEWFEETLKRVQADAERAITSLSVDELLHSLAALKQPPPAEVAMVLEALLLVVDISRNDSDQVDVSWSAAQNLLQTTSSNNHLARLLRALSTEKIDIPQTSWSRLRALLAGESFSVQALSEKNLPRGVILLATWLISTVLHNDLLAGLALARQEKKTTERELTAAEARSGAMEVLAEDAASLCGELSSFKKQHTDYLVQEALPVLEAAEKGLKQLSKR